MGISTSFRNLVKSEKFVLTLLLVVGSIGLTTYFLYRDSVFRNSGRAPLISKKEAQARAFEFLKQRGFSIQDAKASVRFWSFDTPSIYFEKQVGASKSNELLEQEDFPTSGWEIRAFWERKKEEFRVWMSPKGNLIGFDHEISRETDYPALTPTKARTTAEAFLSQLIPNFRLDYVLKEASTEKKPHRIDHTFRWENRKSPLHSMLYVSALVAGNELNAVRRGIDLPESFLRSENALREERNLLTEMVSKVDTLLLVTLILFLLKFRRQGWLRVRPLYKLGLLIFATTLISSFNEFPLAWHDYSTDHSITSFWLSHFGMQVMTAILAGGWIMVQALASDVTGRLSPNASYSLGEVVTATFFRSRPFVIASVAAFGAAGIHLGFVVIYYALGRHFAGFYSPAELSYDNSLSTSMPWISSLLTGLKPALSEESAYRLFAIPVLYRLTKRKWIALVVPALLWGFLHSSYYVDPIYARGLELSIIGIFYGLLFFRFGIWATILTHYLYNATVSSTLLLTSENPWLNFQALGVIGFILVPWTLAYFRYKRKTHVELNFSPLTWPQRAAEVLASLDRRERREPPLLTTQTPVFATILCIAATLWFGSQMIWPQITLSRRNAFSATLAKLSGLGYELQNAYVSSSLELDHPSNSMRKFVSTRLRGEEAHIFLEDELPADFYWWFRWISRDQTLSCDAELDTHGALRQFSCDPLQEARLGFLTEAEAKEKAEGFLRNQQWQPSHLRLTRNHKESLENRTDFEFRWVDPKLLPLNIEKRVEVDFTGVRIGRYDVYFRLPESFTTAEKQNDLPPLLRNIAYFVLFTLFGFLVVRSILDSHVTSRLWSRGALLFGASFAIFTGLDHLNHTTNLWATYSTSTPISVFLARQFLTMLGQIFGAGLLGYILFLLFVRIPPLVFAEAPSSKDLSIVLRRPPWRWRHARTSFAWAIGLVFLQTTIQLIVSFFSKTPEALPTRHMADALSSHIPLLSFAFETFQSVLYWIGFATIISSFNRFIPLKAPFIALASASAITIFLIDNTSLWSSLQALLLVGSVLTTVLLRVRFRLPFYIWHSLLSVAAPYGLWIVFTSNTGRFTALVVVAFSTLIATILFYPRSSRMQRTLAS